MKLVFVKVNVEGKNKPQKTLRKDIFIYYFEKQMYTRKDFTNKLGLNHRVFTNGLKAYYTKEKIEELRAKKIVKTNIGHRITKWDKKIMDLELFLPGFGKVFEDNIKDRPEIIMNCLIELNDKFYLAKEAMKPIKKYANQSLRRLGKDSIKLIANGLEFKIKFILDELKIPYTCQYNIENSYYDFKVKNTLIEVDGSLYHNKESDSIKDSLAKKYKFDILRITEYQIKNQPLMIRKCLKKLR